MLMGRQGVAKSELKQFRDKWLLSYPTMNVTYIQKLIGEEDEGAARDVNQKTLYGKCYKTMLGGAAINNDIEVVDYLREECGVKDLGDGLTEASAHGNVKMLKHLLSCGPISDSAAETVIYQMAKTVEKSEDLTELANTLSQKRADRWYYLLASMSFFGRLETIKNMMEWWRPETDSAKTRALGLIVINAARGGHQHVLKWAKQICERSKLPKVDIKKLYKEGLHAALDAKKQIQIDILIAWIRKL